MLGRLQVITPPTSMPVTLDLVKSHTRIVIADDDPLLNVYIASATAMIESYLNRSILTQTLQWAIAETYPMNSWPLVPAPMLILPIAMEWNITHLMQRDIELPYSPVQSVTSVSFKNWQDTAATTLDASTDYSVDTACDPARVRVATDIPWSQWEYFAVRYTAGYGDTSDTVPMPIIHAILLTVAHMYEHRGDADAGDLPRAVYDLLANYRLIKFW